MAFRDTPAMRLRAAYLTMHRQFQRLFRAEGATADQFVLLTLLAEEDGITQKELVSRSFSDANTITAMLRRLERRGLIRRRPHASDGRAVCVHLTDDGRGLQQQLTEASRQLHRSVEQTLPAEHRGAVLAWLQSMSSTMIHAGKATRKQAVSSEEDR
jgi:DNA-binding MarR family transcriptional regulator